MQLKPSILQRHNNCCEYDIESDCICNDKPTCKAGFISEKDSNGCFSPCQLVQVCPGFDREGCSSAGGTIKRVGPCEYCGDLGCPVGPASSQFDLSTHEDDSNEDEHTNDELNNAVHDEQGFNKNLTPNIDDDSNVDDEVIDEDLDDDIDEVDDGDIDDRYNYDMYYR